MVQLNQVRKENAQAMQKVSTDDLDGSVMTDEQFENFIGDVQEASDVLDRANVVDVNSPDDSLPRISVGTRVMQEATEGEEASLTDVSQGGIPYQTIKTVIAWEVTWESQNETTVDLISELENRFATQFAADIETLGSVGDESASDEFENTNDGFLSVAENEGVAVYDHEGADVSTDAFTGMRSLMPKRFKDRQNLVFLGSQENLETYQESLIERESAAGDAMLMQGQEPQPLGHELIAPNGWPDDRLMMTSMKNLIYVVQDSPRLKVTTQSQRNVLADVDAIAALFTKTDFNLAEADGAVIAENVGTGTS